MASLLRNARLIKQNYKKTLHNQSVQLSDSASELLKEGDRVDAILLTLQALPNDNNPDMPVTSNAIKTLIDTTYAYKTPDPNTFSVVWNYSMSDQIVNMVLSDDKSMLAATDIHGNVRIWDTITHKILFETHGNNYIFKPVFLKSSRILLSNIFEATVYDIATGNELFTIHQNNELVLINSLCINDDNSLFVFCRDGQLYKYSLEDGALLSSYKTNNSNEEITNYKVSENGEKIAYTTISDSSETKVQIFNTVTKETSLIFTSSREILELFWIDNTTLMFSELEPYETRNQFYSDQQYSIGDNKTDIHCYDAENKSESWSKTLSYNYPMLDEGFLKPTGTNNVLYYAGNSLGIYNIKTGREVNSCDLGTTIVNVCDIENGTLYCYTDNGGFTVINAQENEQSNVINIFFPSDVHDTITAPKGIYMTHSNKTSIVYYENGYYDNEIMLFEQGPKVTNSYHNYMNDDVLITICNDTDKAKLYVYDLNDYETLSIIDLLDGQTAENMDIIGLYDGIIYAYCSELDIMKTYSMISYSVSAETIYEIDYQTGEIKATELPCSSEDNLTLHTSVLHGNELVYPVLNSEDETGKIMILNLDTKETHEFSCPYSTINELSILRYDKESGMIFCLGREDCVIDIDNNQYHIVDYPENWNYAQFASEIENGTIYVASSNTVFAVDKTGTVIQEFYQQDCMPQGLCQIETANGKSELLVLYEEFFCRYDTQTGNKLGEFKASLNYMNMPNIYYDKKHKNLIISSTMHSLIIDTNDWNEIVNISNTYGYDKKHNRFLVFFQNDDEFGRVGYFDRYTTDDLIEKAHNIAGEEQLSEESKVANSISD